MKRNPPLWLCQTMGEYLRELPRTYEPLWDKGKCNSVWLRKEWDGSLMWNGASWWEEFLNTSLRPLKGAWGRWWDEQDCISMSFLQSWWRLKQSWTLCSCIPFSRDLHEPLTPSHFICRQRILTLLDGVLENEEFSLTQPVLNCHLRYLNIILNHFWQRWWSEYLTELRESQLYHGAPPRQFHHQWETSC